VVLAQAGRTIASSSSFDTLSNGFFLRAHSAERPMKSISPNNSNDPLKSDHKE